MPEMRYDADVANESMVVDQSMRTKVPPNERKDDEQA